MSKAEDRALEKYPILKTELGDLNELPRIGYLAGFHQAEKDLIDKAIGWIGEIYDYHEIMRYSDSCEPSLEELTEWFKNYMKEGDENE